MEETHLRIDKLLWYLRLARSRTVAQAMAQTGHIRLNSQRVEKAHQPVMSGDVLTIPLRSGVLVIEIASLPRRRGPALEAQSCYRVLDAGGNFPIAAADRNEA